MNLTYFDNNKIPHIVEEYFELSFSDSSVPFQSLILPLEFTNITHIIKGDQKSVFRKKETQLEDLMLSGQFFRSYQFIVNSESKSFGISFHPTALYKILQTDISKFENKHVLLKDYNTDFYNSISTVLKSSNSSKKIAQKLSVFFGTYPLKNDKNTEHIDNAIKQIKAKEGLLNVGEIVDELLISQKTLETQFKKIVGLTPGKYIRKYRFLKLMKKYQSQVINLKDLIYMYNYYDQSHFTKDFTLFMKETPKAYFKKEYPLIKKYLKE